MEAITPYIILIIKNSGNSLASKVQGLVVGLYDPPNLISLSLTHTAVGLLIRQPSHIFSYPTVVSYIGKITPTHASCIIYALQKK